MSRHSSQTVLVVGIGSRIRGDDAIGPRVAEGIAALELEGVSARAVTQLTPELAETLALSRLAVFIDARLGDTSEAIESSRMEPACSNSAFGHLTDPSAILAITQAVFDACPECWLVTIPASDFRIGDCLSSLAESRLPDAIRHVVKILQCHGGVAVR